MSTLAEGVASARVDVAKSAIASPHVYPGWRLHPHPWRAGGWQCLI